MSRTRERIVRRLMRRPAREDGQVVVLVAVVLVSMIGVGGLVIDVGRLHVDQLQLQAAANAAALAGADQLAINSQSTAITDAEDYSATVGDHNHGGFNVTTTAQLICLGPVTMGTATVSCSAPYGYVAGSPCTVDCNGIRVTETTTATPLLMQLFGFTGSSITSVATAADSGGDAQPVDAQVVLDSTASMADDDSSDPSDTCGTDGQNNGLGMPSADLTYEDCAKAGIRALLDVLMPCSQGLTTCGPDVSGDNVADPVDRVGLITFPAMNDCESSNADGTCFDGSSAHDAGYVDPGPQGTGDVGVPIETGCTKDVTGGAESDDSSNMTYAVNAGYYGTYSNAQVVPFSSDYRTSDTATALNGGVGDSPLVNAVSWMDCPGGSYPADDGSGTSTSISGGNAANTTTASDGGGSISEVGSSTAVNATGASGGTTGGDDSTAAASAAGISGGTSGGSSYYATTSTNSSPSSITLAEPADWSTSDFQLATITAQKLSSGDVICAPSGWTELSTYSPETDGSNSSAITEWTFYSTSNPSSVTFDFETSTRCNRAGSASYASGALVVYSGVDTTDPIDASNATTGTSGTNVSPVAVTTTHANDRVVTLFGAYDGLSATAACLPANSSNSTGSAAGVVDTAQASAGTSTPPTCVTASSTSWVATTVALIPQALSAISPAAPPGSGTGSLELVTVDASGLASGAAICAPSGWEPLQVGSSGGNPVYSLTSGSGSTELTQETFYATADPSSYMFSFETSSCTVSATAAEATAVAVAYTGVNLTSPLDGSAEAASGSGGTGDEPAAAAITTTNPNDLVVTLYGTQGAFGSSPPGVDAAGSGTNQTSTDLNQVLVSAPTPSYTPSTNPTAANAWVAVTVALAPSVASSITVAQPSGFATGDVVLATIAVRGEVSAAICSPSGMTWTPVQVGTSGGSPVYTVSSGSGSSALEQETFWSSTLTSSDSSLTFDLATSCSGGSAVTAGASAVALAYSGVSAVSPIDPGSGATASSSGTGTAMTAPEVTTTVADDDVLGVYASDAASISGPGLVAVGGNWTSAAAENAIQASTGSSTPASASAASSAPWTAESVALAPATSVTIARPDPASDPAAAGDLVLVTVTTTNLGAGNVVCPPQDGTWTQVGSTISSGTLSQATFYSIRSTADAENYTFSFASGSSCSGATLLPVAASAIAVRYAGVAAAFPGPVDAGAGSANDQTGSGETLTAPGLVPSYIGEDVVSLYSSAASSFSALAPSGGEGTSGSAPATGFGAAVETDAGNLTSSQTARTSTSGAWVADTIALVATDGGCYGSCAYGVEDVGGDGTYYTGVINQAAASFAQNGRQSTEANVKDAIILVSDGDANATEANLDEPDGGPAMDPYTTQPWKDECQQAVAAAEDAEASGISFYVLYYGTLGAYTPAQSTCSTDTSGDAVQGSYTVDYPGLSSLCAMKLIADNPVTNPSYFGTAQTEITQANATAQGGPCNGTPATSATYNFYYVTESGSLETAFQDVGSSLTLTRLVSNSADT